MCSLVYGEVLVIVDYSIETLSVLASSHCSITVGFFLQCHCSLRFGVESEYRAVL